MSTESLNRTRDRLSTMISQNQGAVGGTRTVDILNDLLWIVGRIQENKGHSSKIPQIRLHIDKLKDLLQP